MTDMKSTLFNDLSDSYESPAVTSQTMMSEGLLCASGSHDPFTEDDSWIELLED